MNPVYEIFIDLGVAPKYILDARINVPVKGLRRKENEKRYRNHHPCYRRLP